MNGDIMSETLYIKLPKELKKELKHLSVEQERTMSEIMVQLLEEYIQTKK